MTIGKMAQSSYIRSFPFQNYIQEAYRQQIVFHPSIETYLGVSFRSLPPAPSSKAHNAPSGPCLTQRVRRPKLILCASLAVSPVISTLTKPCDPRPLIIALPFQLLNKLPL